MDLQEVLQKLLAALQESHWRAVAALALIGVCALAKQGGAKLWKPLGSGVWAAVLVILTGGITEAAMTTMALQSFTFSTVLKGFLQGALTGASSAGFYKAGRAVLVERKTTPEAPAPAEPTPPSQ